MFQDEEDKTQIDSLKTLQESQETLGTLLCQQTA